MYKEIEVFSIIKKYLLKEGRQVVKEMHEPNGHSKFPDFSAMIDDELTYFEITHNQLVPCVSKDKARISAITNSIAEWLPSEYTLFIRVSGPIVGKKGSHRLKTDLSNYLKQAFLNEKTSFSKNDFSRFSPEINITSALFLKEEDTYLELVATHWIKRTRVSELAYLRVIFVNSIIVDFPEDPEVIRQLIIKKAEKHKKAISQGLIREKDSIWLIIIGQTPGFDRPSCNEVMKRLRSQGGNRKQNFDRIFFIFREAPFGIEQEVVVELI